MTDTAKDKVAVFRKWLESLNLKGLSVMFNAQRGLVRVELDKGQRLPAGLVLASTVSGSGDKLVAILPLNNLDKVKTYKPSDVVKGTRLYDNGDGTYSDAEYARIKTVGVDRDGAFTLATLGPNTRGVAGTVPYKWR